MDQPGLPLAQAPELRRRGSRGGILGRPKGAGGKRSADLARYIEATMGGMTPGQQSAELAMVKPSDLRKARELAKVMGLVELDLPPLMLAMAVKAHQLAKALGCDARDAWVMLQKERADLMPYIHQRQAQKVDTGKIPPPATVFMIPEGEGQQQLADFTPEDPDADPLEIVGFSEGAAGQVGQPKSDDAP